MKESTYALESLLIESIERQNSFYKKAFDLSSISSSVESAVKSQIDTSSPGAMAETLARFLVPGILFKINPVLGILDTAASFVHLDLVSLFDRFIQYIKPKVEAGEKIDPDAITQIGRSLAGSSSDSEESESFASLLIEIKKKGYGYYGSTTPTIPFFGGEGSWLTKIFGDLFKMRAKNKAKWLIVGFVTWLIKTSLLSLGLLAVGAAVKGLIQPSHTTAPSADSGKTNPSPQSGDNVPAVYQETSNSPSAPLDPRLHPSGRGEDQHVNDGKTSIWAIPLVGGSLYETLCAWVEDIYPDFNDEIETVALTNMMNEFKSANPTVSTKQMVVPAKYKSRKEIVDKLLGMR